MRYYPKRGFGIELSHFDTDALEEFESRLEELRSEAEDEEAEEFEENGPEGAWNAAILTAVRDWTGDAYDDFIFEEIQSWHEVVPMRIGEICDERGGETTGVSGFEQGVEYLIFDPREQDKDKWAAFKEHLDKHGISLVEGSWSQLG